LFDGGEIEFQEFLVGAEDIPGDLDEKFLKSWLKRLVGGGGTEHVGLP